MYLNEPTAALRVIRARLFSNTGAPLGSGNVFAAGDLKIQKPDNTIANASALPVARAGAVIAGLFDIQVSQAELNQLGAYSWQLHGAAYSDWEWIETVDVDNRSTAGFFATVMDPNADANAQTFQQQWNIVAGYCGGDGVGLDGPVGSVSNLAAPGVNQKHRLEFTIVSGKRVYTKRDGT